MAKLRKPYSFPTKLPQLNYIHHDDDRQYNTLFDAVTRQAYEINEMKPTYI